MSGGINLGSFFKHNKQQTNVTESKHPKLEMQELASAEKSYEIPKEG